MKKATIAMMAALASAVAFAGVRVEVGEPLFPAAEDLWGIFFEDIDLSLDGGVFAEKVRNGSFENWEIGLWSKGLPFEYWQTLGSTETAIVHPSKDVKGPGRRWAHVRARKGDGIANEGYFGIAVEKGGVYDLSFVVRGNAHPLEVSLERYGHGPVAKVEIPAGEASWREVKLPMVAAESDARCRLAFRTTADDEFDIDCVSLMPRDAVRGMFRRDIVEKLAALKPSFLRFPGGCWVEGETMKEAYRWKKTLAPRWERAPQWNIWKYWSSNAVGFYEYLLLCEELKAKPLFCINTGMSHKENVPMDKMGEFVQDALDAIEFCNGDETTKWGKVRCEMGHAAPFNLAYLEIGNENGGKEYEERYALIANAVREKYPDVKLVFNNWKTTKTMPGAPRDLRDDHFYDSPDKFARELSRHYDKFDGDFGIFVGEYAVQRGLGPWGDLRGAIAEAAFMVGLERNSDKVKLAAYAPLFANVEHTVWTPNMLYVSADRVFASPSWTVQKLFSENRGAEVLRCDVPSDAKDLMASAMKAADGATVVKLVNYSAGEQSVGLNLVGSASRTIFTGDGPSAHNSLYDLESLAERRDTVSLGGGELRLPPYSLTILRLRR